MKQEHEIVAGVLAAQESSEAADRLIRQYLPFIRSETAKFVKRIPVEGQDEELSIAMFAFYEAALAYSRGRGAFLSLAAIAIRNRLIDYVRTESRHLGQTSLDQPVGGEDSPTLLEQLDAGHDEFEARAGRTATREEIQEYSAALKEYGLELGDVADNCPKQERTLAACHRALSYVKEHPRLLEILTQSKKLPLTQLADGAGVERKTLERHRKYMVAILLAYTNGFEIIRGHLRHVAPKQGGVRA